ncbi:MAG: hypothetical protein IIT72_05060 [Lachnospiraceae bacterium]|nr:hypothetical protein [Lachnospiraceae bacterium]MBQ5484837.1 hypothetical protein [Lachnospiraceae bacterium]
MLLTIHFGWLGYLALALLFAGLAFVFAKISLQGLSAPQAVLISGVTFLVLKFTTLDFKGFWNSASHISSYNWLLIILYGALLAAAWITFYLGLQMTACVAVAPFALWVPAISFVISWILKRGMPEIPRLVMWSVFTLGIFLMGFGREHKNKTWWMFTIISPILYAVLLVAMKRYPVAGRHAIIHCAILLVMCIVSLMASFLLKHGDLKKVTVYHVLFAVLSAICLYYAPICLGMAKTAEYGKPVQFVYGLWILVTIIGSRLFHREKLTVVAWVGLGFMIAATAYRIFLL